MPITKSNDYQEFQLFINIYLILFRQFDNTYKMQSQYSPFITKKLPIDHQGYTVSFSIHDFDPQTVKKFYDDYGLVIFNDILNEDQTKMSIDDLWDDVIEESQNRINREDPQTWNFYYGLGRFGFVNRKPIVRPQICSNRVNKNVYKAFKSLYEITSNEKVTEPILASFDRASILRPSKLNPDWITSNIYHFDIHPWWWTQTVECIDSQWRIYNKYNKKFSEWLGEGNYVPKVRNFTKLQGVLALSNTNHQSGGFECVCGFQNYIKQWCQKTKQSTPIESCPELLNNMQRVYQRAGSILLFTRQLPHNIYQNVSQNFRYAQYLRMMPQSTLILNEKQKQNRRIQVKKLIHPTTNLKDKIVRELYMLETVDQQSEPSSESETQFDTFLGV